MLGQTAAETAALSVFRTRALDTGVKFGRASTPDLPGYAGAGATTLAGSRIDFDSRGLTTPLGTKGVIYISLDRRHDGGDGGLDQRRRRHPGVGLKGGVWQ